MNTNITYTDGTPVLAKDVSGSKQTRTILDETLAQAQTSRTHRAWTLIPTTDGNDRIIIVSIR